jgi:hypothetical protein
MGSTITTTQPQHAIHTRIIRSQSGSWATAQVHLKLDASCVSMKCVKLGDMGNEYKMFIGRSGIHDGVTPIAQLLLPLDLTRASINSEENTRPGLNEKLFVESLSLHDRVLINFDWKLKEP